jgi:hypothetical protein
MQGQAVLANQFDIDYTGAAFTGLAVPVLPGTIVWRTVVSVATTFDSTSPTLKIGTTSGGAEIATIALGTAAGAEPTTTITAFPTGGFIYLTLGPGPFTKGHATVALVFFGPDANNWS